MHDADGDFKLVFVSKVFEEFQSISNLWFYFPRLCVLLISIQRLSTHIKIFFHVSIWLYDGSYFSCMVIFIIVLWDIFFKKKGVWESLLWLDRLKFIIPVERWRECILNFFYNGWWKMMKVAYLSTCQINLNFTIVLKFCKEIFIFWNQIFLN